mmetsp:Transcript_11768/g.31664  ORF Transcript_11768/g.31664 Transcript_11768/m.31664 type:complete len:925 (-) Transcript_11768:435-3209(-)
MDVDFDYSDYTCNQLLNDSVTPTDGLHFTALELVSITTAGLFIVVVILLVTGVNCARRRKVCSGFLRAFPILPIYLHFLLLMAAVDTFRIGLIIGWEGTTPFLSDTGCNEDCYDLLFGLYTSLHLFFEAAPCFFILSGGAGKKDLIRSCVFAGILASIVFGLSIVLMVVARSSWMGSWYMDSTGLLVEGEIVLAVRSALIALMEVGILVKIVETIISKNVAERRLARLEERKRANMGGKREEKGGGKGEEGKAAERPSNQVTAHTQRGRGGGVEVSVEPSSPSMSATVKARASERQLTLPPPHTRQAGAAAFVPAQSGVAKNEGRGAVEGGTRPSLRHTLKRSLTMESTNVLSLRFRALRLPALLPSIIIIAPISVLQVFAFTSAALLPNNTQLPESVACSIIVSAMGDSFVRFCMCIIAILDSRFWVRLASSSVSGGGKGGKGDSTQSMASKNGGETSERGRCEVAGDVEGEGEGGMEGVSTLSLTDKEVRKVTGIDNFGELGISEETVSTNVSSLLLSILPNERSLAKRIIPFHELYLDKKLAEGAQGAVYLANHRQKKVVVKFAKLHDLSMENMSSIMKEASLLARIGRHDHIVRFIGICIIPPQVGLVMEYCAGGALSAAVRPTSEDASTGKGREVKARTVEEWKKLLPLPTCIRYSLECAESIHYLHSTANIVHRDIKGGNFVLDQRGHIKMIDVGEAQRLGRKKKEKGLELMTGTLRWMANELLARVSVSSAEVDKEGQKRWRRCGREKGGRKYKLDGKGALLLHGSKAFATDVYSFGMLMYEIFEHKVPFEDLQWNTQVEDHVLRGDRPPITPPLWDDAMLELVKRCWDADPDKRPTMSEVVAVLKQRLKEVEGDSKGGQTRRGEEAGGGQLPSSRDMRTDEGGDGGSSVSVHNNEGKEQPPTVVKRVVVVVRDEKK